MCNLFTLPATGSGTESAAFREIKKAPVYKSGALISQMAAFGLERVGDRGSLPLDFTASRQGASKLELGQPETCWEQTRDAEKPFTFGGSVTPGDGSRKPGDSSACQSSGNHLE